MRKMMWTAVTVVLSTIAASAQSSGPGLGMWGRAAVCPRRRSSIGTAKLPSKLSTTIRTCTATGRCGSVQNIKTRQVFDGLRQYYKAQEKKATLAGGTEHAVMQEHVIELPVKEDSPLETLLNAHREPKCDKWMERE